MVTDDDVDVERLQAQVDMSMSFAHDLVTSWIKPRHRARLGSGGANAAQTLEEELRRPPRLGVGASPPMASSLAHETAKLKRRLGTNGEEAKGVVGPQPPSSSKSDDEEHKGRPVKRKTNVDPFGLEIGNKKKRKADRAIRSSVAHDVKRSVPPLDDSSVVEPAMHNSFSKKNGGQTGTSNQRPTVDLFSETFREAPAPVPARAMAAELSQVRAYAMLTPDNAKPLGGQLLNLNGPPELADKPGNNNELNSAKRRRKRRKKKKRKLVAGTGDNSL